MGRRHQLPFLNSLSLRGRTTDPQLGPYDQLPFAPKETKNALGFVRYLGTADSCVLSGQDASLRFPAFDLTSNENLHTLPCRRGAAVVGGVSGGQPRDWAAASDDAFIGPVFLTQREEGRQRKQGLPPLLAAAFPSLDISPLNYFDSNFLFGRPNQGQV
jgi:hypothetical protein